MNEGNTTPKSEDAMTTIRIRKATKEHMQNELDRINREKELGRPITVDDYVGLAITTIRTGDIEALKNLSLSYEDHLELDYRKHVKSIGPISKDAFLGLVLRGEARSSRSRTAASRRKAQD